MTNLGCCSACEGLGVGGPASGPETNGRCADCYATGCAHPGPCEPEVPPTYVDHEVCPCT